MKPCVRVYETERGRKCCALIVLCGLLVLLIRLSARPISPPALTRSPASFNGSFDDDDNWPRKEGASRRRHRTVISANTVFPSLPAHYQMPSRIEPIEGTHTTTTQTQAPLSPAPIPTKESFGIVSQSPSRRNRHEAVVQHALPLHHRHVTEINLLTYNYSIDRRAHRTTTLVDGMLVLDATVGATRSVAEEAKEKENKTEATAMSSIKFAPFAPLLNPDGIEIGIRVASKHRSWHPKGADGASLRREAKREGGGGGKKADDEKGEDVSSSFSDVHVVRDLYYPVFDPSNHYRHNPSSSLRVLVRRIAPLLSPRCPIDRFLQLQMVGWGRHHNQLQALANGIIWAEAMNRTAVMGRFEVLTPQQQSPARKSVFEPVETFYDFTLIRQRYCVVTHAEASAIVAMLHDRHRRRRMLRRNDENNNNNHDVNGNGKAKELVFRSECVGGAEVGGDDDERISGAQPCGVGGGFSAPNDDDEKSNKKDEEGPQSQGGRNVIALAKAMARRLTLHRRHDGAAILVLSCATAFYLRPGVWAMAMLFRNLRPSALVDSLLEETVMKALNVTTKAGTPLKRAVTSGEDGHTHRWNVSTNHQYCYFGIHGRSREGLCRGEMANGFANSNGFLTQMGAAGAGSAAVSGTDDAMASSPAWRTLLRQCSPSLQDIEEIIRHTVPSNAPKALSSPTATTTSSCSAGGQDETGKHRRITMPLFFSSDGQNTALIDALNGIKGVVISGGGVSGDTLHNDVSAMMAKEQQQQQHFLRREPQHSAAVVQLLELAVDFFALTRGAYFTGNQVSSVSQNVCYARLGAGGGGGGLLACDGWVPRFFLYHQQHSLSTMERQPP